MTVLSPCLVVAQPGRYTPGEGAFHVTPTPDSHPTPRVIDTEGDEPLVSTFVAVVILQVITLGAMWLFSWHFAG